MLMVILVLPKKGVCMKMLKVILLGVMVFMFSSVSLAKGPAGGGGGGGASSRSAGGGSGGQGTKSGQPADKGQGNTDNVKPENGDQTRDQSRDQTRDQTKDQTGTKKQDRDRIHTPGTGTATPAVVPATN
jgi:hypothetical protein